jgi:hypothetical protein
MIDLLSIPVRFAVGLASILAARLVLDNIHDRNSEIIVSCLGLFYCFVYVISRRWQYYGLNTISLFGISVSWLDSVAYDQTTRERLRLPLRRSYVVVSIAFAAIVELLCAYRLFTSLLGHGWERLSAPLRAALDWPQIHSALNWLNWL